MIEITTTQNKELTEKLSSLREKSSMETALAGLKVQEKVDKLLLILLDTSGSMSSVMETSAKIDVAWKVFQNELMPNMADWSYGILSFDDYVNWLVIPCTNTNLTALTTVPATRGSTNMGEALNFAWCWARSNAKSARFILLTDGQANDMPKDQILSMAKENNSIPIDTVGIGEGTHDYDPVFLQNLSRITGGMFSAASSVKLLADTIKKLSPQERPLLGTVIKE